MKKKKKKKNTVPDKTAIESECRGRVKVRPTKRIELYTVRDKTNTECCFQSCLMNEHKLIQRFTVYENYDYWFYTHVRTKTLNSQEQKSKFRLSLNVVNQMTMWSLNISVNTK